MKILNLTQHSASPEQLKAGVYNLEGEQLATLKRLLTFENLPSRDEVGERASAIAELARKEGAEEAMIGGAPFLMGKLENALMAGGVKPLYAFSRRESVETVRDGETIKTSVFRHIGFVEG